MHGFTLDSEGRKMSKSLGNVVDPLKITKGGKACFFFKAWARCGYVVLEERTIEAPQKS